MLIQGGVLVAILAGRDSGWQAQRRDADAAPVAMVVRQHRWHTLTGVVLCLAAYLDSGGVLVWLLPAATGLVLAVPVAMAAGSRRAGTAFRRAGLLRTPEEVAPPPIAVTAQALRPAYKEIAGRAPGLVTIACDVELRSTHMALVDESPDRARGEIDAAEAVAAAKIGEARTLAEAIAWLRREELAAVIAAPSMLERLARLPAA
jgi:membrane glycosyltransferase